MVDISNIVKRMRHLEHFKGLSPSELMEIVRAGQIRHCSAGTTIYRENDSCSGLYVLFRGQVHLYKLGPEGQENIISIIKPVIMFNEVAVLDGGPNPLTAVTFKDSMIWRITSETFNYGMQRYPKIAMGLLPVLASRTRWLISQYEDLSFLSVRDRTAKLLLELSDNGRQPINRRDYTIYEMAARVATVPEAISRSLSFYRDLGVIESSRTTIIFTKPDELAQVKQVDSDFEIV